MHDARFSQIRDDWHTDSNWHRRLFNHGSIHEFKGGYAVPAFRMKTRGIWAGVASCGLLICSSGNGWAQAPAATGTSGTTGATAPFTNPQLSPSMADFVTGVPVSRSVKSAFTNPLLREGFAGQPTNTPKGLAAAIKADQLDAKCRCKAVAFLGTVDCVDYPESQKQLVGALQNDKVEKVRYCAALAIQQQLKCGHSGPPSRKDSIRRDCCKGCCNDAIREALAEVAYGVDKDSGCPLEPSPRVRQAAADALNCCCDGIVEGGALPMPVEGGGAPNVPGTLPTDSEKTPPPPPSETPPGSEKEPAPIPQKRDSAALPKKDAPAESIDSAASATAESPKERAEDLPEIPAGEDGAVRQTATTGGEPASLQNAGVNDAPQNCPPVPALRGYCVVALKESKLIRGQEELMSVYEGRRYNFSSAAAKQAFDAAPAEFAPALSGIDVVILATTGERVPGVYRCDYEGRMYFFRNVKSREKFMDDPEAYTARQ